MDSSSMKVMEGFRRRAEDDELSDTLGGSIRSRQLLCARGNTARRGTRSTPTSPNQDGYKNRRYEVHFSCQQYKAGAACNVFGKVVGKG